MFALSTSWNYRRHNNGFHLVDEIKNIGFEYIELNFALTRQMVEDVLCLKEKGLIHVVSLHNICPLPEGVLPHKASPDYYSLASPDEEERALALQATKNTIIYARRFGAKVVVLHAGRVEVKDRTRRLASAFSDKVKYEAIRLEMIKERQDKKDIHFDSVMKSLDELVGFSKENGVALGVENRYYYREIPSISELEVIFKNFKPGDIFYWHDVGHAEVFERLGLDRHEEFLKRFGHRLIGVHFHDIMGLTDDHKAPLCGTFDFKKLIPYIGKDTLKVIEAHHPATGDEIRRGRAYLERIFGI